MNIVIGIDGGGTGHTMVAAETTGTVLAEVKGGSFNLHTKSVEALAETLRTSLSQILTDDWKVVAVCLGSAGVDSPEDEVRGSEVLAEVFPEIDEQNRILVSDVVTARRSGDESPFGMCLISGTGSNAFGVAKNGTIGFTGGREWLLGDDGSGYWIGHMGLRAAVQSEDGRAPSSVEQRVKDRLGVTKMGEAIQTIYHGDFGKDKVAEFAQDVDAAANEGDSVAVGILTQAAMDLVLMMTTLAKRLELEDGCGLVLIGSVIQKSKTVSEVFCKEMANKLPQVNLIIPADSPAIGAVKIAIDTLE